MQSSVRPSTGRISKESERQPKKERPDEADFKEVQRNTSIPSEPGQLSRCRFLARKLVGLRNHLPCAEQCQAETRVVLAHQRRRVLHHFPLFQREGLAHPVWCVG